MFPVLGPSCQDLPPSQDLAPGPPNQGKVTNPPDYMSKILQGCAHLHRKITQCDADWS